MADAEILSYNSNDSNGLFSVDPSGTANFDIALFNGSIGKLESASYRILMNAGANFEVENSSGEGATVQVTIDYDIDLSPGADGIADITPVSEGLDGKTQNELFLPMETREFLYSETLETAGVFNSVSGLTGSGTFQIVLDIASNVTLDLPPGTSLLSGGSPQASPIFSTTYNYTAKNISGTNNKGDRFDNYVNLGGGDDIYNGKDGDDIIIGGRGDDIIRGGNGFDQASYSTSDEGVVVSLSNSGADVGGGQGADEFVSIEGLRGSNFNDELTGDTIDNKLFGLNGGDILKGFSGDDDLFGGGGVDTLFGNSGADFLDGGNGNDEILGGSGADVLLGQSGKDLLKGGSGRDSLVGGSGDDELFGNSGNDNVQGGNGDDMVYGGNNDDRLSGGSGTDVLIGGNGADEFLLNVGDDSITVEDFQSGRDVINLRNLGPLDLTDLEDMATDLAGGGVEIDLGGGDVLIIKGDIEVFDDLTSADFIFF